MLSKGAFDRRLSKQSLYKILHLRFRLHHDWGSIRVDKVNNPFWNKIIGKKRSAVCHLFPSSSWGLSRFEQLSSSMSTTKQDATDLLLSRGHVTTPIKRSDCHRFPILLRTKAVVNTGREASTKFPSLGLVPKFPFSSLKNEGVIAMKQYEGLQRYRTWLKPLRWSFTFRFLLKCHWSPLAYSHVFS